MNREGCECQKLAEKWKNLQEMSPKKIKFLPNEKRHPRTIDEPLRIFGQLLEPKIRMLDFAIFRPSHPSRIVHVPMKTHIKFLKSRLANRGVEVFPYRVSLYSGSAFVIRTTWPLRRVWRGRAQLDLVPLPPIARALCNGMIRSGYLIDRPWSIPTAVLRNML